MAKQAISVTLDPANVTWLKGRAGAAGESVSELIDQLVAGARQSGRLGPARTVVGTVDVDSSDPDLGGADALVRGLFERSLGRPMVLREERATYGRARKGSRKRRG